MGVADLVAGCADDLASRGLLALYEAGVGEEVLDAGEAGDVVELVEKGEAKNGPDAGNGLQELQSVGILDAGLAQEGALEGADDLVVASGQDEVGLDVGAHHGVRDRVGKSSSIARIEEPTGGAGRLS